MITLCRLLNRGTTIGEIPPMDNIVTWNIRGLNLPNKQEDLKIFLHSNKVGFIGLLETKIQEKKMWKRLLLTFFMGGIGLTISHLLEVEFWYHGNPAVSQWMSYRLLSNTSTIMSLICTPNKPFISLASMEWTLAIKGNSFGMPSSHSLSKSTGPGASLGILNLYYTRRTKLGVWDCRCWSTGTQDLFRCVWSLRNGMDWYLLFMD